MRSEQPSPLIGGVIIILIPAVYHSVYIWDLNKQPLPSKAFSALAVHESLENTIDDDMAKNSK